MTPGHRGTPAACWHYPAQELQPLGCWPASVRYKVSELARGRAWRVALMHGIKVYVFDAYGTLFEVLS